MSFFDELGLKAAEQLEASVGPFVALASYKRLLAGPPDVKSKAVLGMLRCALALDEDREIELAIGAAAAAEDRKLQFTPFAIDLMQRGKVELAASLAETELARTQSALAAYVRARAVEATLGKALDACATWGDVADRALETGDADVLTHATSRLVAAWLAKARKDEHAVLPRERLAIIAEKTRLDGALEEEKLLVLRGRLLSASNFQRASALSALEEIARKGTSVGSRMAIATSCRHFDEMPFHLHAIEVDRVRACLKRLPEGPAQDGALARLEATTAFVTAWADRSDQRLAKIDAALGALTRASDLARASLARLRAGERVSAAGAPATPFEAITVHATNALVAAKSGAPDEMAAFLDRARALLSPDVAVPMGAWMAATVALSSSSHDGRAAGAAFVGAAFARTTSLPPPKLVDLAARLVRAGAHTIAELVLAEATRFREPEARAAAADTKRKLAYDALAKGDRETAWTALREARAYFTPSGVNQ